MMRHSFRFGQLALTILLVIASAICLLKYLGWAWVVSGAYGLPSQAKNVAIARHLSLAYFWGALLAEGALIVNLAVHLKLDILDVNGVLKALARGFTALIIAAVGTVSMMFLLNCLGKLLSHR